MLACQASSYAAYFSVFLIFSACIFNVFGIKHNGCNHFEASFIFLCRCYMPPINLHIKMRYGWDIFWRSFRVVTEILPNSLRYVLDSIMIISRSLCI